jgi:outer membrane protein assembly factor BamD (BamD/ComL family)
MGSAWVLTVLAAGCQSGVGPLARWRMARDSAVAPGVSADEIGDKRGPMARLFSPRPGPPADPNKSTLVLGSDGWAPARPIANPAADKELAEAESLYQQGKTSEAEQAFARIAKKRKESRWGETAQFRLAELQFKRGDYRAANDSYVALMTTYTGSRYRDKAVAREYEIAQTWLAANDPKLSAAKKLSWTDRFTGKLPLIDPTGHALSTLEHVRQHDPTGPLADVAVLRIADHHYANENYDEASVYYDQLLDGHPKSSYARRAQLASIDSKLKSYVGPEYDATGLDRARELIKNHIESYPERLAGQNDSLYHTLDLIRDQEAERAYRIAEHYFWVGKVTAAEYSYAEIPLRWPRSEWAKKAKIQLAQIATMPRQQSRPSKIMSLPGSTDPLTGNQNGSGYNGAANAMGMPGGMGAGPY